MTVHCVHGGARPGALTWKEVGAAVAEECGADGRFFMFGDSHDYFHEITNLDFSSQMLSCVKCRGGRWLIAVLVAVARWWCLVDAKVEKSHKAGRIEYLNLCDLKSIQSKSNFNGISFSRCEPAIRFLHFLPRTVTAASWRDEGRF